MIRGTLAVAVLCLFAANACADPIAVKNPSFENPVQDPGGWTNTLPDWDGPANAGDSFIEYIAGFSAEGNNHIGMAAGAEVSQNLGVGLMPNTTYELTVAVGRRNASFTTADNDSRFGIYAGGDFQSGGTLVADMGANVFSLSDLTFEDHTLTFSTSDALPAGDLYLSLRSAGGGRVHFDNIRLSAVPEPASIGLALVGLLGLAARRRR